MVATVPEFPQRSKCNSLPHNDSSRGNLMFIPIVNMVSPLWRPIFSESTSHTLSPHWGRSGVVYYVWQSVWSERNCRSQVFGNGMVGSLIYMGDIEKEALGGVIEDV